MIPSQNQPTHEEDDVCQKHEKEKTKFRRLPSSSSNKKSHSHLHFRRSITQIFYYCFFRREEQTIMMIKSLLSRESPSFEGKLFLRLHPFSSWINIKDSLPHLFSSLLSSSASKTRGFDRKERNKNMMLFFPAVFSSSCFQVILNASQETSALNIHSVLTLLLTRRTSLISCFKTILRDF